MKGAREKSVAAAIEKETDADSESEDDQDGSAGGRVEEEESQVASGSSVEEWIGAEDDRTSNFVGQGSTASTKT